MLWRGHETEALNFIRQAKGLDVNPKMLLLLHRGRADRRFPQGAGQGCGIRLRHELLAARPPASRIDWFGDAAQFAKLYKEKYGYEPDYHAASAVADVETFVKAIEKAGSLDPQEGARRHRRNRFREPLRAHPIRRRMARSSCRRS